MGRKDPLGDLTTSTTMADENMEIEQETPAPVEVIDAEPLDTVSALKKVLKKALCADGLARGIRECAKMLDKRAVHLCVLADNCNEPAYKKLIEALCTEHSINLMKGDDNSLLGEWALSARWMLRVMPARLSRAPVCASPTTVSSPKLLISSSRISTSRRRACV